MFYIYVDKRRGDVLSSVPADVCLFQRESDSVGFVIGRGHSVWKLCCKDNSWPEQVGPIFLLCRGLFKPPYNLSNSDKELYELRNVAQWARHDASKKF